MIEALFQSLLRASAILEFLEIGPDGVIIRVNRAFADHVGMPSEELPGTPVAASLAAGQSSRIDSWLGQEEPPPEPVRIHFVARDGSPYSLRCVIQREGARLLIVGEPEAGELRFASGQLIQLNNELATVARERARRERELERTRQELARTLDELQSSYWHLKRVQEVLPICMGCGKIKGGHADWQSLADYLRENEIFLSHGYCPSCAAAALAEHGLEDDE